MTLPDLLADEDDPGTEDADLSVYTQEDLFDPSDCGGPK